MTAARKALIVRGGWDGHMPVETTGLFIPFLEENGFEVRVEDGSAVYADADVMAATDLIVQANTMTTIEPEEMAGLYAAVVAGTGMAGWHGGMGDSFRNNPDYQYMTGGQFVIHPGGVIDYTVKIVNQADAVTKGLKSFAIKSEQYYMHVDPNVKVLATTTFTGQHDAWIEGCVIPVTWKKMHGKGRVFYTSVGHNVDHLVSVPDALEMLKRGISWASASKYLPAEKWVSPLYK